MESWQRRRLWRTLVALVVVIGFLIYAWSVRPQDAPRASRAPGRAAAIPVSTAPWEVTSLEDTALQPALLADLAAARTSIDVAMYVIRMDAAGRVNELLDAVAAAARRGVAVRILLDRSLQESDPHDLFNRAAGARLQEARASVRFDRPEIELHDKLVIIDDRIVYVGAHNWTPDALGENHELSLRILSQEPVSEATASFEAGWAEGNDPGRIRASQPSAPGLIVEGAE